MPTIPVTSLRIQGCFKCTAMFMEEFLSHALGDAHDLGDRLPWDIVSNPDE